MLEEVKERVYKIGISIEFSNSVASFIVEKEDNSKYGARPLDRAIKRFIEFPISEFIMSDKKVSELKVNVRNGNLVFKAR